MKCEASLAVLHTIVNFINLFASAPEPLQWLTESKAKFQSSEECDAAFNQLRQQLTSSPLLVYPELTRILGWTVMHLNLP